MSLAEQILEEAATFGEGEILTPRLFLQLGSRAAIDQSLSRLAKSGRLLRVARGEYVVPVVGRFGSRPPSPEKTLQSLAQNTGEMIAPNGASTANALGLTTQVATRETFITSGRNRRLKLGARIIELKHAPAWQLAFAGEPAGNVVRVLAWLGPTRAPKNMATLRKLLPPAEWKTLARARSRFPGWMATLIARTVAHA